MRKTKTISAANDSKMLTSQTLPRSRYMEPSDLHCHAILRCLSRHCCVTPFWSQPTFFWCRGPAEKGSYCCLEPFLLLSEVWTSASACYQQNTRYSVLINSLPWVPLEGILTSLKGEREILVPISTPQFSLFISIESIRAKSDNFMIIIKLKLLDSVLMTRWEKKWYHPPAL